MELRLPGGNLGGAVLVDGTVRREVGPWTPSVHALLRHLETKGFAGAPRVHGLDERGREVLSFLAGNTVGDARPWPEWVHSDAALIDVGVWLRGYHAAVADFVPAPGAQWRGALRPWERGDVIGHNDAAPYNAVWRGTPPAVGHPGANAAGRLVGFIDWDFAAPCSPVWDLAFVAFSWVPLHARHVVSVEGFTRFADRPRRLRVLLDAYRFTGTVPDLLTVVRARIENHADGLRRLAAAGDPVFTSLVDAGVADSLDRALRELAQDAALFAPGQIDLKR